jgi:hypothetical protein
MPLIETLTIGLGAALLKTTAKVWLGDFSESAAGAAIDTFKKKIEDFETRRATERLFDGLQDEVGRRLKPVVDAEFRNLPENERTAAALAVADVFNELTLSDAMLGVDLDAARLEAVARPIAERHFRLLGADTQSLGALLLRESCNYVVTLAGKLPNFQVAATREILKRHTQLQDELGKVLDSLAAMRTNALASGGAETRDFDLQYRRALDRRLDRLELFGVRYVSGGPRDYPLTIAYVSLTAVGGGEHVPMRVEEALGGRRRVVVRGEAGSGKTTLLRWLAVRAANRDFSGPLAAWNDRTPFYLALRNYTATPLPRPEQFLDHVTPNLADGMPKGWVHETLRKGALLLVDGVDELPAARRSELAEWLRALVGDFDGLVAVISSRPAALDAEKPFLLSGAIDALGFTTSILQPMALADSEALVVQWHAAVARDVSADAEREKLYEYERDLRQMLRDRASIRNLASSPLLCAMICALNWDRRRRVPDQRMELYRAALDMLLEARDVERGVHAAHVEGLDRAAKEELLDSIAYWMLRNGLKESDRAAVEEQIDVVRRRLARVTAASGDVLQELLERSGVLNEPQHGVVSFIHRTFLEYMGARAAVAAGDIPLLADQAKVESWRETIVFAAGHAQGMVRDRLVRELLKKPWLTARPVEAEVTAACCLETVGASLDPSLLTDLKNLARRLFPPKDVEMAHLLAPAAALDPKLLEGHRTASSVAIAGCIRAAATVGGPRMLSVIEGYADVQGVEVETELAMAWQVFEPVDYFNRVIKHRESLLQLRIADLDAEAVQCLHLLLEIGELTPPFGGEVLKRLTAFSSKHDLTIARQAVRSDSASTPEISARTIRRIASFQSVRQLGLGDVDPAALPSLSTLPALRSLRFSVAKPCTFDWLGNLPQLSHLVAQGHGLAVVNPNTLARCSDIESLELHRCRLKRLTNLPLSERLLHLALVGCAMESLKGIDRAPNLGSLVLHDLNLPLPDGVSALRHLRSLHFSGVAGAEFEIVPQLIELEDLSLSTAGAFVDQSRPIVRVPQSLKQLVVECSSVLDIEQIWLASGLESVLIRALDLESPEVLLHLPALRRAYVESHGSGVAAVLSELGRRGVDVSAGTAERALRWITM